MNHLQKRSDESITDYLIRIYSNLHEYGLDYHSAAELMNKEQGSSYNESKWRKDFASYKRWKDYIIKTNLDEEVVQKYEEIRLKAEISKVQNADQKREYRKMIRHEARFLAIKKCIEDAVENLNRDKPFLSVPPPSLPSTNTKKEDMVLFSDWHYGMEVDNRFNKFNSSIFKKRVEKLVAKTIANGLKNGISTLHVAQLGDLISGQIHTSTRVQSNEDLIEQITQVTEILAEVLVELANNFEHIKYYNVIGNHSRAGKKDEMAIKENYEYLIPWYLEARLKDIANIELIVDKDGLIETEIHGEKIILAHGNFDSVSSSVKNLSQMFGYVPDYIITGHIHHHEEKDFGSTKHIVNPSLIGVDDYAVSRRLYSIPSQKYLSFDSEGLEAVHDIKLNIVA
ncbi:hypothetical protein P8825_14665 [Shouchella clausii]|uniref:hypothetical protein n=1 Tax=Shouchella clausii TaxID=79880 RepID=UPI002DB5FA9C|nr:hypothetical protein [Shouchella clausii]MEB5480807.1 hypothetical protein [Shouchella clausii]